MSLAKEFDRRLNELFARRTSWLHSAVGRKRIGPPWKFTRSKVEPSIERLADIAKALLLRKQGIRHFQRSILTKRQWQVKGFGTKDQQRLFKEWFNGNITGQNFIYVFWSTRGIKAKCVYVGRTIRGKNRPAGWFDRAWFGVVDRIDIYTVRTPGMAHKVECLAIDRFRPRRNLYRSSRHRFARKCPVCVRTKEIRKELKGLFRLR